jgi:hypothetical protein
LHKFSDDLTQTDVLSKKQQDPNSLRPNTAYFAQWQKTNWKPILNNFRSDRWGKQQTGFVPYRRMKSVFSVRKLFMVIHVEQYCIEQE